MRYFALISLILLAPELIGQDTLSSREGNISYITSQNIYVRFSSTQDISVGDTLYITDGESSIPALVVTNLSSISCVCAPLLNSEFKVGESIFARLTGVSIAHPGGAKIPDSTTQQQYQAQDILKPDSLEVKELKQDVYGRVSVSSYTNFSNTPGGNSQRMRYTLSLGVKNIAGSRLSADTYISFVHSNKTWDDIKSNIFNGLKIYSLAVRYDFNETTKILLGRKINPVISNIGAIDGLQFEKGLRSFKIGAFAGSRPDYSDYSVNFDLFQFGVYVGHEYKGKNGMMQSSIAFADQENDWNTDRRFLYFQHANSLVKNLNFFGTIEFDLYKMIYNEEEATFDKQQGTFDLTNLYLMLRYRVIKQLSMSLSYTNRQNIVYYETYKTYLDRILDPDNVQGVRFQVNARPVKNLSAGLTLGYREGQNDPNPTKNLYGYATYGRIPKLDISATASVVMTGTAYMTGLIYSGGISREFLKGKLTTEISYRRVNYDYKMSDISTSQNMGELNIGWNIYKKLFISAYYEGTFEKQYTFNRIFLSLTQRF